MKQSWIVALLQFVGGDVSRDGRRPAGGDGDLSKDVENFPSQSVDLEVDR